jgi:hypothetical protein
MHSEEPKFEESVLKPQNIRFPSQFESSELKKVQFKIKVKDLCKRQSIICSVS